MTSFVHEHLVREGQLGDFDDNRPRAVRCVHPLVTLLERLDALMRRLPCEDAARIVRARASLPPLVGYGSVKALGGEMLAQKQIATLPSAAHAACTPSDRDRWCAVHKAHEAIGPMFWGPRLPVEESCAHLRLWLADELG